jgi:hypothetical protein
MRVLAVRPPLPQQKAAAGGLAGPRNRRRGRFQVARFGELARFGRNHCDL